jgi:hypothetical protein
VDAFLGEWLSPDYFENITPPPSSVMMVAGAKADLLRCGDYGDLSAQIRQPSSRLNQLFPGGWGNSSAIADSNDDTPLASLSALSQALPKRDRASSHSSVSSTSSWSSSRGLHKLGLSSPTDNGGYQPPTPGYAISPSDPIPSGYVAHARDACACVDFQWDSMRDPHNWGNGGEYGEEWNAMHKRFRQGIQCLLSSYSENHKPEITQNAENDVGEETKEAKETESEDEDDGIDTVIILVTHGAGCNALIGALTHQPVLMDVGMASLTMAVRRDIINGATGPGISPPSSRRPSRAHNISDDYDVRLIASTEHLRAGANPLIVPQLQSSNRITPSMPTPTHRHRYSTGSNQIEPFAIEEPTRSVTMGSGISRRSTTIAAPRSLTSASQPRPSSLLWSPSSLEESGDGEPGDDMVLNFSNASDLPYSYSDSNSSAIAKVYESKESEQEDTVAPLNGVNVRKNSQTGLWGSPLPAGEADRIMEKLSKRRWTTTERAV